LVTPTISSSSPNANKISVKLGAIEIIRICVPLVCVEFAWGADGSDFLVHPERGKIGSNPNNIHSITPSGLKKKEKPFFPGVPPPAIAWRTFGSLIEN
jgi:hypothetical protein